MGAYDSRGTQTVALTLEQQRAIALASARQRAAAAQSETELPIAEPEKTPDSFINRMGLGALQPVVGAAQVMSRPLSLIGDVTGNDYLKGLPEQSDQMAAALRENAARGAPEGVDWGQIAGQTAATLPLGALKVLQAGKYAPLINNAVSGAVTGAALSNTNDASLAQNAGIGAAANMVANPLMHG